MCTGINGGAQRLNHHQVHHSTRIKQVHH